MSENTGRNGCSVGPPYSDDDVGVTYLRWTCGQATAARFGRFTAGANSGSPDPMFPRQPLHWIATARLTAAAMATSESARIATNHGDVPADVLPPVHGTSSPRRVGE